MTVTPERAWIGVEAAAETGTQRGSDARTEAWIVPLAQAGGRMPEVGGKAARLGALLAAGERVPDGFCVVGTGEAAVAAARAAYRELGADAEDVAVAVRSSASVEDGREASFAGQFETVLNVRGEAELAEALARCWRSAKSGRVAAYRGRSEGDGEGSSGARMAVLVQRMVGARAAGVAFSANPLSGARHEVVIEGAEGLGDRVVSGEARTDELVVGADGGVRLERRGEGADRCVSDGEAREIAALARRVAARAGGPQDIEWALDGSGLWLLQARPMTALPEAVRWESPVPGGKWVKDFGAAEWAREPLSPLGATTTFAAMARARQEAGGWPPLPKAKRPEAALLNGWLYLRADLKTHTLVLNLVGAVAALVTGTLDGHRRVGRRWPARLAELAALEGTALPELSEEELRGRLDGLLEAVGWWWMEFCWCTAVPRVMQQLIAQLRVPGIGEGPGDAAVLFRGNDSLMLEAQRALRRAAADEREVGAYVARFGHMVESGDPIDATLGESPEQVAWQLRAARGGGDPDERLGRLRGERVEAEAAVRALGGLRGFMARRAMAAGQSFAAHADDAVFHLQRAMAGVRAAALERGRRLAAAGVLGRAEDVFYLERDELWRERVGEDLAGRVVERRERRERQKRLAPPAFVPAPTDAAWGADASMKLMPPEMRASLLERGVRERDGRRVLVGGPGSPGRARGIARVVSGPADFGRFEAGDILVAHATAPVWTPLLAVAGGAVTEVGGPLSHAAIVAREFGIPLVDGAVDATRVIADGSAIVVDGSAGVVELG